MLRRFFSFACLLAVLTGSAVRADEATLSDLDDEMQKMKDVCEDDWCDDCGRGRAYAAFDVVYLETHGTEDTFNRGIDDEFGYRLTAGYERADGLGVRFRWFSFKNTQPLPGPDVDGLELDAYDLELTQAISFCNLYGTASVGYRHAEYTAFTVDPANDPDEALNLDGITLGVDLNRDLTDRVALFTRMQYSMLYGDDNGSNDSPKTLMGWTEVQAGVQYSVNMDVATVTVRTGIEAQRHEGGFNDDTEDTGLIGGFISFGASF